jgi:protein ImuB
MSGAGERAAAGQEPAADGEAAVRDRAAAGAAGPAAAGESAAVRDRAAAVRAGAAARLAAAAARATASVGVAVGVVAGGAAMEGGCGGIGGAGGGAGGVGAGRRSLRSSSPPTDGVAPWPGRVPPPAPAHVAAEPLAVEVVDATGAPVGVTGRGLPTGDPARLRRPPLPGADGAERWIDVDAWAGPWPVEERWWDPASGGRRARLQVVDADGVAHLLALEHGRWWLVAVYD